MQFQLDNMQFQLHQFEFMKMYNKLEFKGSSSLHVLDKFSISLQLDRLLVSSNDDSLPKFALSGTLPKLSAHINEDKIHAVDRIIGLVFRDGHPPSPRTSGTEQSSQTCLTSMLASPGTVFRFEVKVAVLWSISKIETQNYDFFVSYAFPYACLCLE